MPNSRVHSRFELQFGHSDWGTTFAQCRMDSKTIHSTIDAPPGVPGVSKNHNFIFTYESIEFLAEKP